MLSLRDWPRWWAHVESHASLAFLGFLFIEPSLAPRFDFGLDWWFLGVLLGSFLLLHFVGRRTERHHLLISAAIASLGFLSLSLSVNHAGTVFFVYAADVAVENRRPRDACITAVILFCSMTLALVIAGFPVVSFVPYGAAIAAMLVVVIGRVRDSEQRANLRTSEKARLQAVSKTRVAERERISRDLHDLLGQTLTTITLKCELALRLLEQDSNEAKHQISEVIDISRKATTDVRSVVYATRRWTLQEEIEAASRILRTASIDLDVQQSKQLELYPAIEAALALALREGVTNIVKHSMATRVILEIQENRGFVELTLTDNGNGTSESDGLQGIRERITQLGGNLHLTGTPTQCTLRVTLANSRLKDQEPPPLQVAQDHIR